MKGRKRRRGALLLEVVVALVIITAAMGMLGAQLVGGMQMVSLADQNTRTAELADRAMALLELDLQYAEQLATDQKMDGDFGDQYPGYFWHVHIDPLEVPGLGLITIQVLHQNDREKIESSEGATVVRELHYLKAAPQKIDLAADFGFDEDQITTITNSVPLPGISGGQLDVPALIKQLTADPTVMMQMLPALMQAFSGMVNGAGGSNAGGGDSIDAMRAMMEENMRAAMNGEAPPAGENPLEGDVTGDGVRDASDLLQLRDQMFGQQGGGGNRGPRGLGRGRGGMPKAGGDGGGGSPEMGGDGEAPVGGGGGRGNGGGADGDAPPTGGRDPAQALEELMRLREEFNRKQRDGG